MLSKFKVPHTLVLLYTMIVIAYVLTLIVPPGSFQTEMNDHGRDVVIPNTYQALENVDQLPIWSIFTVIPRGLEAAQGIIFFVFLIGGALAVIRSTGMIDAVLSKMLSTFGDRPFWLILMCMLLVAVGASSIGMSEEFIPFTPVLILLCISLRMDAIVAAGVLVIGSGIGYGAAAINPFTVLVAQEVAGVQLISGLTYRLILFVPFFAIAFYYLWRYASTVRSNPSSSLVADINREPFDASSMDTALTMRHSIILVFVVATLILLVWGISQKGWYLVELGAIFVALGIIAGLIGRLSLNAIAKTFSSGAAELTGTALLIGFRPGD